MRALAVVACSVLAALTAVSACDSDHAGGTPTGDGGGQTTGDCAVGDQEACFAGSALERNVGTCVDGVVVCSETGWGECVGEVGSQPEICGNGLDDDCDGAPDDGCSCASGETQACYGGSPLNRGVGFCHDGVQLCVDGLWEPDCVGQVLPATEICDGFDNDCEGDVDEGCACIPGETAPCYSGPPATIDVGECHAGTQQCVDQGLGYGACSGEVAPKSESCPSQLDRDCDGTVCGQTLWAKRFGTAGHEDFLDVATDAAGNVYLVGRFDQTLSLGSTTLGGEVGATAHLLVVALDPGGDLLWARAFPSDTQALGRALAVDVDGNLLFGGCFQGTLTVAGTPHAAAGDWDAVVGKLAPDGTPLWLRTYGGSGSDCAHAIASDGVGDVLIAGRFGDTVTLEGQQYTSNGGLDVFVLSLDPSAEPRWSRRIGGPANDLAFAIDANDNGTVVVAGSYRDTMTLMSTTCTAGITDAFVAKYSLSGSGLWGSCFGTTGYGERVNDVAIQPNGGVVIAGRFAGSFSVDGVALNAIGGGDAFVARIGTGGLFGWATSLGDADADAATGLALAPSNDVVVAGDYLGSPTFGSVHLPGGVGSPNLFVTRLDAGGGAPNLARGVPVDSPQVDPLDGQLDAWRRVALDPDGNVIVAGYVAGAVDFGTGGLTDYGGNDAFVAKLAR